MRLVSLPIALFLAATASLTAFAAAEYPATTNDVTAAIHSHEHKTSPIPGVPMARDVPFIKPESGSGSESGSSSAAAGSEAKDDLHQRQELETRGKGTAISSVRIATGLEDWVMRGREGEREIGV
ncbi:hypothetical protein C8A03DRAFT_38598 [Achaetomium macrosporum]|uniref:Uncharacterized protein n=1 Tax=Achaetomium macrosporum TaxID=79813 RepID=A0AAN7C1M1_9PEZI|nr:hypothetical protein C8A03DRAFT_38598 [Achaetomium macrosporum]